MDTPRVSQMWKILQETNKLPHSQVLAGAEEELQELMRQIDIMVQSRKAEWEREKQALMARLDIKEKEQLIQSSTLEEKHKEIGHLRAQLELVEQSHRNATAEYEKQLSGLREQFLSTNGTDDPPCFLTAFPSDDDEEIANMKKEFEKLHRRYSKKAKQAEAIQQRTSTDSLERTEELKRLNNKLEEFRKRAKDWEKKRRGYEDQIELLQKQMLMLQDGPRQLKASGSEPSVSEVIHSNEMLSAEKQQLQTSLQQMEKLVAKLQKELEQLRSENEMTQQIITDQRQLISKLEETLKQNNTPTRRTDNTSAEYERQIRELKKQISDLYREKEMLALELQNMTDERKEVELKKMQEYTKELSKLKAGQQTLEEAHEGEIRGLKNELQSVTRELHEKTRKLAELQERLSTTEKKAREYVQLLDRTQAELQVAMAQRDALRLENQNLRHLALSREGFEVNKTEAEYHLRELQRAYNTSVSSLESQNKKLMSELATLKTRLSALEADNFERSQHVLNESRRSLLDLQDTEQKRIIELERKYQKEMQAIQEKLNITVQQYESQIEALRLEMSTIQDELDLQNQSIQHFSGDQRVMAKFVYGASNLMHATGRSSNNTSSVQDNTSISDRHSQSNGDRNTTADFNEELDEDFLPNDSVEAAKARFLEEQRERTRLLEQQLDSHIQYLKQCTNETIRKHSIKSH